MNHPVTIRLSRPMYEELHNAARQASRDRLPDTEPISIEQFAQECVEAALATRRLDALTELGLRIKQ
jgi:hypothetical protein